MEEENNYERIFCKILFPVTYENNEMESIDCRAIYLLVFNQLCMYHNENCRKCW